MVDWNKVGETAFYRYFNTYDKTHSHDEAQELVSDEIGYDMEDAGIELEGLWYEDLPAEHLAELGIGFMTKMNAISEEVGYEVNPDALGPMHTWIHDAVSHAEGAPNWTKLKALLDN